MRCDAVLQVRRMTGALVAVGRGRLLVPQLKEILEARDSLAYPEGLAAPAHGLFLTRVDYRDTGEEAELQLSKKPSCFLLSFLHTKVSIFLPFLPSSDLQFSPQTTEEHNISSKTKNKPLTHHIR